VEASGTFENQIAVSLCHRQIEGKAIFWSHDVRQGVNDFICVHDLHLDLDFTVTDWPALLPAKRLSDTVRDLDDDALHRMTQSRLDVGGSGFVNDGAVVGPKPVTGKDRPTWVPRLDRINSMMHEVAPEMRDTDVRAKREVRRHVSNITDSMAKRNLDHRQQWKN